MKNKHMFSLLDDSYETIKVSFDPDVLAIDFETEAYILADNKIGFTPSRQQGKTLNRQMYGQILREKSYTYKVPKSWCVEPGDRVLVVSPRSGLTVVTVIQVDGAPDIDVDANIDYKWAVQKVDMSEYEELVNREQRFSETMLQIERVKQRESLINSFRESLPEDSEARRMFEKSAAGLTSSLAEPQAPPSAPEPQTAQEDTAHPSDPDEGHLK